MGVGTQNDLGAPNFRPKNDLMHWVLHKKSIGFSEVFSKKKKVLIETETVFLSKLKAVNHPANSSGLQ